ncbi:MAG TPA: GNAT family N-acetyltransferase [Paenibacillus sp.]|jgi:ribosomal protein S18 acetylase RimI-like enzyme
MVTLIPMNEQEYEIFVARSIVDYADDKVKAGTWASDEAQQLSVDSFKRLLPEGRNTPTEYLYSVVDTSKNTNVGALWIHISEGPLGRSAFIYDILVYESFQGQGYGTLTMSVLDEEARKLQVDRISLHVFGHNKIAFALYQKMGYEITDISMTKML